jgi:hypothetical protein
LRAAPRNSRRAAPDPPAAPAPIDELT